MTFFIPIFSLLVCFTIAIGDEFIEADNPFFRYVGRVDDSNPKLPKMDWPGVYVEAVFSGTTLSVELDRGMSDINILIDSQLVQVIDTGSGNTVYSISQSLDNTDHHLLITKRNENGPVIFKGLHIEDGASLLPPPPQLKRKLLIIGNSYSVGYGNESISRTCTSIAPFTNSYLAYGPITARALSAEYHIIAISGFGVVRNYGSSTATSPKTLPSEFDKTIRFQQTRWDFNLWTPDVIVLNLGTNDLSTEPSPSQSEFTIGTRNFINRIRSLYPLADLVYLTPPKSKLLTYIEELVGEMNASDTSSPILFLPYNVGTNGCDWHPNTSEQKQIAAVLYPAVDSIFQERERTPIQPILEDPFIIRLKGRTLEVHSQMLTALQGIKIFNLNGQLLVTFKHSQHQRLYSVPTHLKPGIYLVQVQHERRNYQKMMVFEGLNAF